MGKVQFQVDGLDANTTSIFNDDVTFDGNVDAASISIGGTDILQVIPPGPAYSDSAPSNPTVGQVWIDSDSSITEYDLSTYQQRVSGVSDTEIGYLDGVTSSIQTQLNSKSTESKSETLTNKTIALGSNTVSGTVAQFNTALSDDNFVTINGSEYPKNKTFDNTNLLAGAYSQSIGYNTNQGNYGMVDANNTTVHIGGSTAGSNFSLPPTTYLGYGQHITLVNTSTVAVNVKTETGTLVNILESGQTYRYTYSNATGVGVVGGWIASQAGFADGRIDLSATSINDIDPLVIKSKNGHGGTGYSGITQWTNSTPGATNPNKHWRINSTGTLEIINSEYTATIFSLTDDGVLTVNGAQLDNNAWVSWSPALSTEFGSWTIGNGSNVGAYKLVGKTCHFRAKITFGSTTSTGSGALQIGLPFAAVSSTYQFPVSILDSGNAWYQAVGNGEYNGHTSKFAMIFKSAGTGTSSEGVSAISPFTFGSGDYISVSGTYEVA